MKKHVLAIHGGAGTLLQSKITPEEAQSFHTALNAALMIGNKILLGGGSAHEAVGAAVKCMEDSPLFNAGRGAVFSHDETHEMEASIMRGDTLQAGAVAGISRIKNPIELAAAIMDDPQFVFLIGKGAEEYAAKKAITFADHNWFYTDFRYKQLKAVQDKDTALLDHDVDSKFGTVGAVACDVHGNLAAATSTGGLTNKKFGRIGDSAIIGAGTYANNQSCAVSCTGYGEYFLRSVVAYDVACLMQYTGLSLSEACNRVVKEKLVRLGGEGGLIAVDSSANAYYSFNSEGMYRGMIGTDEPNGKTLIFKD
jgi:L-asparaginase / beta-aspartyl-peptidase